MLFRRKIDRYCTYCMFARKVNNEQVICEKQGIVLASHHCRRFRYDPLKRIPPKAKVQDFSKYEEKDFSL